MEFFKVLFVDPADPLGDWTVYTTHRTMEQALADYDTLRATYRFVQIVRES